MEKRYNQLRLEDRDRITEIDGRRQEHNRDNGGIGTAQVHRIEGDNEKVCYHNSWITDIPISEHNIRELVRGGLCRWKVGNETFNTLKNQGII